MTYLMFSHCHFFSYGLRGWSRSLPYVKGTISPSEILFRFSKKEMLVRVLIFISDVLTGKSFARSFSNEFRKIFYFLMKIVYCLC